MFSKTFYRFYIICALILGAQFFVHAQNKMLFFKDALKEKRTKFYNNIVANNIITNLSLTLNKENEEGWINAFDAINLVKYKSVFVDAKIDFAIKDLDKRSYEFKQSLLALINNEYQKKYAAQIKKLYFNPAKNATIMAMAAHYLIPILTKSDVGAMQKNIPHLHENKKDSVIFLCLYNELSNVSKPFKITSLLPFFAKDYLPVQVLIFSFQRHDRNYPGIAIVRNSNGSFVRNNDSSFFYVPQLARAAGDMPSYISMGNTPQGIFRMDGFDTSKSFFIGPTTNIQLTMPFEYKAAHFFNDSTISDSSWSIEKYKQLLPYSFRNNDAMLGTWYAGAAGRNEIIAHGTTIDPAFYKYKNYYPFSPTAGCLTTIELWNDTSGFLQSSDQLKLTEIVKNAGGPKGYLIVIELDDKKAIMSLADIMNRLK